MQQRIEGLDLWRSVAVVAMLAYHAVYDLEYYGLLTSGITGRPLALALRWACAGSFILISGAAARFSRNLLQSGFCLFCVALAVTAVTLAAGQPVVFGILHCLGLCRMLCCAIRVRSDAWNRGWFVPVCAALFVATTFLTQQILVDIKFLFPLGFRYEGFYSADYYPLFPWIFLFFIGTAMGKKLEERAVFYRYPRWTTFLGRHSLLIYLLHQPVFFGLAWAIRKFT